MSTAIAQDKPKSTRNDLIYPSAEVAKPFINFDGKGFIINGKRTFLSSGSIHYPRVPSLLWEDRLLRLKRAGFEAVETYAFWNFHEPKENAFDFNGDKDIGKFLTTSQKIGLYAIVRVGPYVCAEWDFGGYPVWLKFKPPFQVRTKDPNFLKWNDHWYDHILPIVAKHQINHGGNVLLVQLENEHPLGWGVVNDDPYFTHLYNQAIKHKIEVPYFFSGLHHGGPPGTGNTNTATRQNPWFSTEFWSGWFDAYRALAEKRLRNIDNSTWSIQAHAGGGYNFYMIHGGTNFETWNDASTAASYDYGTAIGQTGDLRLMYYRMKRANQLAQSFPKIIGNATDEASNYKDFISGKGIEILGAPQSKDGTIVYLRNFTSNEMTATFKTGETLKMSPYGTYPIPVDVTVAKGVKIVSSTLPILAVTRNEQVVTLIMYGQPGEKGRITLKTNGLSKVVSGSKAFNADVSKIDAVNLSITIPANGVEECILDQKGESIRVLAINKDLSLYTWIIGKPDKQFAVFGSSFLKDLKIANDKVSAIIERPYGEPSPQRIAVYGAKDKSWNLAIKADMSLDDKPASAITKWKISTSPEAIPSFDDSKWLQSTDPLQMGADGDYSAFAWYRTTINAPTAGKGTLKLKYSNNIEVYINGKHAVEGKSGVMADFVAGKNSVVIFASHSGRNKEYNYLGTLNDRDNKGIISEVVLNLNGQTIKLSGWKMRGGASTNAPEAHKWTNFFYDAEGLPSFFQTTFKASPPSLLGAHPILRVTFKGLSRGTMWVNGHNLGRYPEKIRINSLYIPECWLKGDNNSLVVFDEAGANPSQVELVVEKLASREIIKASKSIAKTTPIVVPQEYPLKDLVGQNVGNIAFRKQVTVLASANGSLPESITDGDFDTEWAAKDNAPNSWFTVDLEKPESINVVEINWEQTAKNYTFTLEASNDNLTWTKIGDQTTAVPSSPDSPSELSRLNLQGKPYRYVKVTINKANSMKVVEFKAFVK